MDEQKRHQEDVGKKDAKDSYCNPGKATNMRERERWATEPRTDEEASKGAANGRASGCTRWDLQKEVMR